MKVAITGGTGFVGTALTAALLADGHEVSVLTRGDGAGVPPGARAVRWPAGTGLRPEPPDTAGAATASGTARGGSPDGDGDRRAPWRRAIADADAVVNLAGESIAAGRWTPAAKERIRGSRLRATRAVVAALAEAGAVPGRVLVSASAVGYYGDCGEETVTEAHAPGGDFLAGVCAAWEAEAARAEELGVRTLRLRIGVVLGLGGGVLPRLVLPFRLFAGGPLGSGRQWMPWIHRDDLVGLIRLLIARPDASGAVNAVAPAPARNAELCRALGRALGRPCWLPAPAPALRLLFGEMADALLLGGQRAMPERALALDYRFSRPELEPALRAALGRAT